MAGLKLNAFGGFVPRVAAHLLNDNEGQKAVNTKLYSGSLRPWFAPLGSGIFPAAGTQAIYKTKRANGSALWFAWQNAVDVVKSPLQDTNSYSIIYTGDGVPKKTNTALSGATTDGQSPSSWLNLGVGAPAFKPAVTRVGSGGSPETRIYVYTYISEFGDVVEESAPSPVSSEVLCGTGDTVTVNGFTWSGTYAQSGTTITVTETAHGLTTGQSVYLNFTSGTAVDGWFLVTVTTADEYTVTAAAAASTSGNVTVEVKTAGGQYNITKRRIYRSVAGTNATEFQFVTEISRATTSFSDNVASAGLGETLKSQFYTPPPDDLAGLVLHPSGFLIGFSGTDIYFSEVNRPHAWPVTYSLKLNEQVVGLGVFGTSVAVMTKGSPFILTGLVPESMSAERVPMIEPCVSKRSITADTLGVSYASPNGIVMLGPGADGLTTTNVMLRQEFSAFYPETMRSAFYAGKYMGFYTGTSYGITDGAMILDRNNQATPLTMSNVSSTATFVDPDTANLYLIINNEICQWEGYTLQTMPYEWKSKRFIFTAPANMGAIEIDADFYNPEDIKRFEELQQQIRQDNIDLFIAGTPLKGALNQSTIDEFQINGSILQNVPNLVGSRYVLVSLYCDDRLIYTGQYTNRGVYRLPSGFKGQTFELRIAGNIELRYVKVAETVKELKTL